MKVAIIGTGKMGSSLARGVSGNASLILCGKEGAGRLARELGAIEAKDAGEAARAAEVVIIAVKPNDVEGVLEEIHGSLKGKLLISIAAGITEGYLGKRVPKSCRIALAMPNLAVAHKKGATVYFARNGKDAGKVEKLLHGAGAVLRVKNEHLMDCAFISSSGIAFFFSAISAIAKAAEKRGMESKDALLLAAAAAEGAGSLAKEESAEELEKKVATKKGITEHGLKVLRKANVKKHFGNAANAVIKEARKRRNC